MKIYMAKEYVYRRWQTLLGGAIATLLGGGVLFLAIRDALPIGQGPVTALAAAGIALTLVVPSLLFSAGLWILHACLVKRVNRLEISDVGIRYGQRAHRWEQIKWISCHALSKGSPTLFYQKVGFSFDHNLILTEPLTDDEIEALFGALRTDVAPLHPHLEIG